MVTEADGQINRNEIWQGWKKGPKRKAKRQIMLKWQGESIWMWERKKEQKTERKMNRDRQEGISETSHPRTAHGQRHQLPFMGYLGNERWEQGSDPKGLMSSRTLGRISIQPGERLGGHISDLDSGFRPKIGKQSICFDVGNRRRKELKDKYQFQALLSEL